MEEMREQLGELRGDVRGILRELAAVGTRLEGLVQRFDSHASDDLRELGKANGVLAKLMAGETVRQNKDRKITAVAGLIGSFSAIVATILSRLTFGH